MQEKSGSGGMWEKKRVEHQNEAEQNLTDGPSISSCSSGWVKGDTLID